MTRKGPRLVSGLSGLPAGGTTSAARANPVRAKLAAETVTNWRRVMSDGLVIESRVLHKGLHSSCCAHASPALSRPGGMAWLTRQGGSAGGPSLRLKNGSARDDCRRGGPPDCTPP
jgi:hypothetical protein